MALYMQIEKILTPALLLDYDVMLANMEKMDQILQGTGMKLYPHYKTHKSTALAKLQMERGAGGITCAKLSEARDLLDQGIRTLVIANQIVQPEKIAELASMAKDADITVCVDQEENIAALQQACASAGSRLKILVEFEVGMKRCGVESFRDFLRLAMKIKEQPCLTFEGIQAYAGNLAHELDAELRHEEMQKAEARVRELADYLAQNGVEVREVAGTSTGTVLDKPKDTLYTQIQAGSYVFMDASYARLKLPFEQALHLAVTVLSVKPDRFVVDCGVKSLTMDQVPPYFPGYEDCELSFSEEHTTVFKADSGLHPGDTLLCVPGHCCTTVNNFKTLYVLKKGAAAECWPIESAGKAQ